MNCSRLVYILLIVVIAISVPYKSFSDVVDIYSLPLIMAPINAAIARQIEIEECIRALTETCHSEAAEYCSLSPEDKLKEDLLRCAAIRSTDWDNCLKKSNSCQLICKGLPDEQQPDCLAKCIEEKKSCMEVAGEKHTACWWAAQRKLNDPLEPWECIDPEFAWCVGQAREFCNTPHHLRE